VVIALIVTPDGLPLAHEVMPGNTSDKTTLRDFLRRIEAPYGKAGRTWVMDRGIPTEAVMAEMRAAETPTHHPVGTLRERLSQMEKDFLGQPWAQVRDAVQVKLVEQDGELYIPARSGACRDKEQAMRRRRLKKLVKRLHELRQQKLTRDQLLIKLGAPLQNQAANRPRGGFCSCWSASRKLAAVALANKMARIIWASGQRPASKAGHMTAFEPRPVSRKPTSTRRAVL
jgi:hypothetical protein